MPFRFSPKYLLLLIFGSLLAALLLATPSYAKNEKYTWSGNTIVGSGGIWENKLQSTPPGTFTMYSSGVYRNYTGTRVPSGACGFTLTVNLSSSTITKISQVTCNTTPQSVNMQLENAYNTNLTKATDPIKIAGTAPKGSDTVSAQAIASARSSGTYAAFEGKLDSIRTTYCNQFKNVADPTFYSTCINDSFPNMVYSCWTSARSAAASAARYDPKTDTNKVTKASFISCLASKTGYTETDIAAQLNDINIASINGAATASESEIKNRADKTQCTSDGGTWNDASSSCEVSTTDEKNDTSSCGIDYVGWIVCPAINFLAGITDLSYNFLADSFLSTPTRLIQRTVDGKESAIYTAWKAFQNIANILLVIGFLMIIYSQLTGVGLTNYSIKKMLPKIIVAALLINLSFYICAIAIDLSNILGYGLKSFLASLANADTAINSGAASVFTTGDGAIGFAGIAVAVLGSTAAASAAAGGISLALVALIGVLVSAAIALITIFFILMIRQVFIVFLIVISPVAFAMYFLPNTKQWFDKWKKIFTALLLVFPIIGVVYGASTLASTVLSDVYTTQSGAILGQIIAAAVMILPLFVVPGLLKKSLDSVGTIGGKISSLGEKYRGKAKSGIGNSGYAKYQKQKAARRREEMRTGNYTGKGGVVNPSNWRSRFNRSINGSSRMNTLSGGYTGLQAERGAALLKTQDKENMDSAEAYVESLNMSAKELEAAALSKDGKITLQRTGKDGKPIEMKLNLSDDQKRASLRKLAPIMTGEQAERFAVASKGMDSQVMRNEVASAITSSGAVQKAPHLGGLSVAQIQQGTFDLGEAAARYSTNNINAEQLASMDATAIKTLRDNAANDPAALAGLMKAKASLENSPSLKGKVKALAAKEIEEIGKANVPSAPRDNPITGQQSSGTSPAAPPASNNGINDTTVELRGTTPPNGGSGPNNES